jgi:hypothetical protein
MDELERKKIDTIPKSEIMTSGVQALGDRLNLTAQYGKSGLTPAQLKKWFDNLSTLAIEKINAIINAINEDNSAVYIGIDSQILKEEGIDNLAKLVEALNNGNFGFITSVYLDNKKISLQGALTSLGTKIEDAKVQVIKLV